MGDRKKLSVSIHYNGDSLAIDIESSDDMSLAIEFLEAMNKKRKKESMLTPLGGSDERA